jgi:hypothetical protein
MLIINNKQVSNVDISGKGGAEKKIFPIFENNLIRINDPLYDAIEAEHPWLYEFKKQQNLQWFDVGKYHNLTEKQRAIIMTFVNYDDDGIDRIFTQDLGSFLDTCCADTELQKDGWTITNIKAGAALKKLYPKMQFKVPLKTRPYFNKYADKVNLVYSR